MRDDPAEDQTALTHRHVLAAATLGVAMAGKAVEILDRYLDREQLTRVKADGTVDFDCRIPAPDGAVFTAIVEAANDYVGVFDDRPPEERRWDALLQLIDMAAFAAGIEPQLARAQSLRLTRSERLQPGSPTRPCIAISEESGGQNRRIPMRPGEGTTQAPGSQQDRRSRAAGSGPVGPS
jgi:hypothetical protein